MSITVREKPNKSGSTSLYLDIYHEGKRKYEFLGIQLQKANTVEVREHNKNLKQLAESVRAKRELEMKNNQFGFTANKAENPNFFTYFDKVRSRKKQALGVWQSCRNHFRRFLDSKEIADLKVNEVTASLLEDFQAYLLDKVSNNSAKNVFGCIGQVVKQSQQDGLVLVNPFGWVKKISGKANKRSFLTIEEIKLLSITDCENDEVKRSFLFSCLCGLRLGDCRRLAQDNVKNGVLEIVSEKTQSLLQIPLHQDAIKLLGTNYKVFNLPKNVTLGKVIRNWVKLAGIDKHVTYHVSRHTFASFALANNVSIFTVSKLMGHSKIQTTQIYSNLLDSSRKEAIDSLPSIF